MIILRSELNVATFWICMDATWVDFNNFPLIYPTDRNKISSDQKRLFFAESPFNFSRTLPLKLITHLIEQFLRRTKMFWYFSIFSPYCIDGDTIKIKYQLSPVYLTSSSCLVYRPGMRLFYRRIIPLPRAGQSSVNGTEVFEK